MGEDEEDWAEAEDTRVAAGPPPQPPEEESGVVREAEGLRLHLSHSSTSSTGYRGVYKHHGRFRARLWRGGKEEQLGSFDTAVEAAVAYARAAALLAKAPPPLLGEEAMMHQGTGSSSSARLGSLLKEPSL